MKVPFEAEEQFQEALFRYLLDGMKCLCFLGIDANKDPADGILDRLKRAGFKVQGVSSLVRDPTRDNCVVDRETGERGCQFTIRDITSLEEDYVAAEVLCYSDGETANNSTYHLKMRNNQWAVEYVTTNWVS